MLAADKATLPADGLRALLVVQRLPPARLAGAELQAMALAQSLTALGAHVDVLSTQFTSGLPAAERRGAVRIRRLAVVPGMRNLSRFFASAFVGWRDAARYDVVHGVCLSSTTLGTAVGAARAGVPVVLRPSLGGPAGEIARLVGRLGRSAVRELLAPARLFTVLDEHTRDELLSLGVEARRVALTDNGVDLERFRPRSPAEREAARRALSLGEAPAVVFVGQLVERKGVSRLLRAFRLVRARIPNAKLLVVGDGPLANDVRGEGVVALGARRDVESILAAADVFVLPSEAEGFSNALLEALSSGLPIVTTRRAAPSRAGVEGCGRFVDKEDDQSLADAMVSLLEHAHVREPYARAARAVAEHYGIDRVARSTLAHYARAMDPAP